MVDDKRDSKKKLDDVTKENGCYLHNSNNHELGQMLLISSKR